MVQIRIKRGYEDGALFVRKAGMRGTIVDEFVAHDADLIGSDYREADSQG